MAKIPSLTEVVNFMRKDYLEFVLNSKMEREEAISRLLEEYERVSSMSLHHKIIVLITAVSISRENGYTYSNLEKNLIELLNKKGSK